MSEKALGAKDVENNNRQPLSEAVKGADPTPALGSPHDGYAAALMTISFAVGIFFLGIARVDGGWIPFAAALAAAAALITSVRYYARAHSSTRGIPNYPAMPMVATYFALMVFVMFVPGPLYAGFSGSMFGYGLACLVIATLAVAPMQAVLSKDPNRDSATT